MIVGYKIPDGRVIHGKCLSKIEGLIPREATKLTHVQTQPGQTCDLCGERLL